VNIHLFGDLVMNPIKFGIQPNLVWLAEFAVLANRSILDFHGSRGSCIFSSACVCDVLAQLGIEASPLRVTAKVFHPEPRKYGCVLGSDGNGERMPAAGRDKWHGHLVSLVAERFLVDTTLDQVRDTHRQKEPGGRSSGPPDPGHQTTWCRANRSLPVWSLASSAIDQRM
jgi:hypothetical protein